MDLISESKWINTFHQRGNLCTAHTCAKLKNEYRTVFILTTPATKSKSSVLAEQLCNAVKQHEDEASKHILYGTALGKVGGFFSLKVCRKVEQA